MRTARPIFTQGKKSAGRNDQVKDFLTDFVNTVGSKFAEDSMNDDETSVFNVQNMRDEKGGTIAKNQCILPGMVSSKNLIEEKLSNTETIGVGQPGCLGFVNNNSIINKNIIINNNKRD